MFAEILFFTTNQKSRPGEVGARKLFSEFRNQKILNLRDREAKFNTSGFKSKTAEIYDRGIYAPNRWGALVSCREPIFPRRSRKTAPWKLGGGVGLFSEFQNSKFSDLGR